MEALIIFIGLAIALVGASLTTSCRNKSVCNHKRDKSEFVSRG